MNFLTYRFRQIKKLPGWIFWLAAKILFGIRYLMRTEIIDDNNTLQAKELPAIGILWHNRLLSPVLLHNFTIRRAVYCIILQFNG